MLKFKDQVQIGEKTISLNSPTYTIAEVGSNHNGSLDEAIRYIHQAKKAGVDAVKFQSFSAEGLLSKKQPVDNDPQKGWQLHPVFSVLEKLELPEKWHFKLKKECERVGIEFLSAPFDIKKARLLKEVGVRAIKIASGELTHLTLLKEVSAYGVPLILSTGAATLEEVGLALDTIYKAGCREVVLLHCVSAYPPRFEDMNVRAVETLVENFMCPVGISDHTPGWTVPLLSCVLGGRCVEKHVTFDRKQKGPDHPFALEWSEFEAMVQALRNAEKALGDGIKKPMETEISERIYARKGLYANVDLKAGEILTAQNTKLVRHAFGISALDAEKIYGKKILKSKTSDEAIFRDDVA